jgi:hypothetical protein
MATDMTANTVKNAGGTTTVVTVDGSIIIMVTTTDSPKPAPDSV